MKITAEKVQIVLKEKLCALFGSGVWFFPAALFWLEGILRLATIGGEFPRGVWYTLGFSVAAGLFCYALGRLFSARSGRILCGIVLGALTVLFMAQVVYFEVFTVFYTLFSIGGAGQILQFASVIAAAMAENWWALLLMAVPMVVYLLWGKEHIVFGRSSWCAVILPFAACMIVQSAVGCCALLDTAGAMSVSRLYTTDFISNLAASRFGMLTTFRLEARNAIIGPLPSVKEELPPAPAQPIVQPEAEAQVMQFDFAALAEETDDAALQQLYRYFGSVIPSTENEFTGRFAGKNLIFLTCESLWKYAIDPELTPNLYRLSQEGFQFTDFYNPIWGVSTLDGEYVNLLSLLPVTGTWSLNESDTHWLPFSLGNQFKAMGYTTRAYHNHTYNYYHRDRSHPNLGYDYKGIGNGLEIPYIWPESDVDMMNATLDTVLADEHFMTYYLTVSGHLEYNFFGNAMCVKHKAEVAHLDLPEAARAYLACNIELDRAVGLLLEKLEETGHLEDTVLVLAPDHYPYGLDTESLNALAGKELDEFSLYQSCFFIWCGDMQQPVVIDKPVSSLDILPTLCNLFDLEYDSRLMMGTDMLSERNSPIIFQDHSWLTRYGCYNASTDVYTPFIELQHETIYVTTMNRKVDQAFEYSKRILRQDLYRKLWQDAGLSIPD